MTNDIHVKKDKRRNFRTELVFYGLFFLFLHEIIQKSLTDK